jgi:pyruvate/2-oxoglutarate/acetoin dehydrogenase E1 component
VASAIISYVSQNLFESLKKAPKSITWPNHPVPASYGIENKYYPTANTLAEAVSKMLHGEKFTAEIKTEAPTHSGVMIGPF